MTMTDDAVKSPGAAVEGALPSPSVQSRSSVAVLAPQDLRRKSTSKSSPQAERSGPTLGMDAAQIQKKNLITQFQKAKSQLDSAAQKHESLLADLRKKDESYARREQKYQDEISEMRQKLSTLVLPQQKDDRILTKIEIMHEQILTQIDRLDDATQQAKDEHHRDLMAHLQAKLYEAQVKC